MEFDRCCESELDDMLDDDNRAMCLLRYGHSGEHRGWRYDFDWTKRTRVCWLGKGVRE